jgi:molybdenum cofactor synthesis domain-containing protein
MSSDPAANAAATAAIGLIGDELLSGKVVDENAQLLIGELRELGVALRRIVVLPDVLDDIARTVLALSEAHTHVFTSGGVGPTHDDLTMEGIARAFGTRVVRHPLLEAKLRGYYGERLAERNLRMAEVPEGCTLVGEDDSTLGWPVVAYRNVYILPGVPQIFRRKWAAIRERFRQAPFFLKAVYTTLDEGAIAHHLDAIVATHATVQVGSYPRLGEPSYRVKITLESKDQAAVERACARLCELLGAGVVRVE